MREQERDREVGGVGISWLLHLFEHRFKCFEGLSVVGFEGRAAECEDDDPVSLIDDIKGGVAGSIEVIFFSFEGDGHFLDLIFAFFRWFFVEAEIRFCDLIGREICDGEGFREAEDDVVCDGGSREIGWRADHIDGDDSGCIGRITVSVGFDGDDAFIALCLDVPSEGDSDVAEFWGTGGLAEVERGGGRGLCGSGSHEAAGGEGEGSAS